MGGFVDTFNDTAGFTASFTQASYDASGDPTYTTLSIPFATASFGLTLKHLSTFDLYGLELDGDGTYIASDGSRGFTHTVIGLDFLLFGAGTPFAGQTQLVDFDAENSAGGSIDGFYDGFATVSSVPLPASAPMFGAALVTLGGIGYGLKRRRRPRAA